MANWQSVPEVNDSVWSVEHGNGIVLAIDISNDVVHCDYYLKGKHDHSLDEFFGCFDEKLNQWVLVPI